MINLGYVALVYDWALIDSDHPDHPYLIRRSINDKELAFYRCYNPHHAPVGELVNVAGARWPIDECFGSAKNETGLDHYQVRTWNAWHRHITLAMLAHTFLAVTAHTTKKKGHHHTEQPHHHDNPPEKPTESETAPPIHRRLINLTLAEIRRLLNLHHRDDRDIAHGLHWSIFRRWHQAQARRDHVRRNLRLQTLMI